MNIYIYIYNNIINKSKLRNLNIKFNYLKVN